MENKFQRFKQLHEGADPLIIANVWNAQSAQAFEKAGYRALATSSAAVAESMGYPDGEKMRFDEYWFVIKSIVRSTTLPVSVDMEGGYGADADDVIENLRQLASIGVVGVNIEDSSIKNGKRELLDAESFAAKISTITKRLASTKTEIFINLRSDTFLLGIPAPVEESKRRINIYSKTGAHGLFFPCITASADIEGIVKASPLPVNVMCMPALPDFKTLKSLGVKRVSMGNFVNKKIYGEVEQLGKQILKAQSFESVIS